MAFGKVDAGSMVLDTPVNFGETAGIESFNQLFALLTLMPDQTAITIESQKQFENGDSLDDLYTVSSTTIVRDTPNGRDDLVDPIEFHPQIKVSANRNFRGSVTLNSSYIDEDTGSTIPIASTAFDFYWEIQSCS